MERLFKLPLDNLQLPPGSKGKVLPKGSQAKESELEGLSIPGLLKGGYLVEVSVELKCPACAESGTAAQKKETYKNPEALREHYAADHPALEAPA